MAVNTTFDAVRMKKMYPHLSGAYIGRRLGVSRQRVHQILSGAGLPTRAIPPQLYCLNCGGEIDNRKVHQGKCDFEYYHRLLTCYGCGKEFYRARGQIELHRRRNYDRYFHSPECFQENR